MVLVQNQSRRFPKKWYKSGTVVAVRANDQYTVQNNDGSGRLTLRKRRYLRKFTPHMLNQKSTIPVPSTTNCEGNIDPIQPHLTMPPDQRTLLEQFDPAQSQVVENLPVPIETTSATTSNCVGIATSPLCVGNSTTPTDQSISTPCKPVLDVSVRPRRQRNQRTMYDATSGKAGLPKPVPEDI